MKWLIHISRVLVGLLFIASGLIKANDPMGFSFKLEEYYGGDVFGAIEAFGLSTAGWWQSFLEWCSSIALETAIIICIFEVLLGVAILIGKRMKLVSTLSLLMIIFFTFLTWYAQKYEVVKDCGCFGDAIKLTPEESYYKDVVLLVFVAIIFFASFFGKGIKAFDKVKTDWIYVGLAVVLLGGFSIYLRWWFPVALTVAILIVRILVMKPQKYGNDDLTLVITFLACLGFTLNCYRHLPMKDYRPYAIGKDLNKERSWEGRKQPVVEMVYPMKNTETGEEILLPVEQYMKDWEKYPSPLWEMGERMDNVLEEGDEPDIHDFDFTEIGTDDVQTDLILNDPSHTLILVCYDLAKTDKESMEKVKAISEGAEQAGVRFIGLTSSVDIAEEFRHEHQLGFPFYSTDGTALKTVVRSNPGLLLIKGGKECWVKGKWHYNDLPDSFMDIESDYIKKL